MIYFVQHSTFNSGVKIGYTEDESRLTSRIRSAENWSPWGVTLLATCNGGRDLEQRIHKLFSAAHLRGDWFSRSAELTVFIGWCRSNPQATADTVRLKIDVLSGAKTPAEARKDMRKAALRRRTRGRIARQVEAGEITIRTLDAKPE